MTLGEKIADQRKAHHYTQEQLAEILGVTRQSISKWESDLAYPETEKLIRMGTLFDCSMDYLLKEEITDKDGNMPAESMRPPIWGIQIKEKKSDKLVFGLPLYHIGKNAKGFIAIGLRARGVISIGLLSMGVFSLGVLSLGLIALGSAAAGLLALGAIAVGLLALGAISIGVISIGAAAIGYFSFGAAAVGKYAAIGDSAQGLLALGKTTAHGKVFEHVGDISDRAQLFELLDQHTPAALQWAKDIFAAIFR